MTAPDGSRLTRLDRGLWVDLDEVVAVRTSIGHLQERRVTLTLANGAAFDVVAGAAPGTGHPRTDEEKDAELADWLRRLPAYLLEGLRDGPTGEEIAAQIGGTFTPQPRKERRT